MSSKKRFSNNRPLTVALIAPSPPPYGGLTNQALLLERHLIRSGVEVRKIVTNRCVPHIEHLFERVPGLRTVTREFFFIIRIVIACFKCEVLHVMACSHLYFFLTVLPSILVGRTLGRYVVVNYRGGEANSFFRSIGRPFVPVLRKANEIIVPGTYLEEVFAKIRVKVSILPNIVDLNRFPYRLPPQNNGLQFVCTRNFEPYYDVATAIRAFDIVKATFPHARLTLIGDGAQREDIKRLLERLDLNQSVAMLGKIDFNDVAKYLYGADIFVNSSVTDNYPNSILEAFACGLPVVTTAAGGIPYLVEHENNGLLVPPRDYKSMAEAMIRLANDHQLCLRLAKAGKETADRHSWQSIWPLLQKAYNYAPPKNP